MLPHFQPVIATIPAAALRLLLATLLCLTAAAAQGQFTPENILSVTPTFKPTINFAESYSDFVVPRTNPPEFGATHHTALKVVANIEGLDINTINPDTYFAITFGDLNFASYLSADLKYRQGHTSATFPLGNPGVKLSWTARRLTITVTLTPQAGNLGIYSCFVHSMLQQSSEFNVARAESLHVTFASLSGARTVYITGTFDRVEGQSAELNRIRLTGRPDVTPPVIRVSGLTSGMVIDDADPNNLVYLRSAVTAHDKIALPSENPVQFMTGFSPQEFENSNSWQPATSVVQGDIGIWGPSNFTGLAEFEVGAGPNYVQFRAFDIEGNEGRSPIYTIYRSIPPEERGAWAGVLIDTGDEGPMHTNRNGTLQFIVDARGVILSGVYRYMDTGADPTGAHDGAYRRIPFTGPFGPQRVIRMPRTNRPDLLLSVTGAIATENGPSPSEVSLFEEGAPAVSKMGFVYRTPYGPRNPAPQNLRNTYHLTLDASFDVGRTWGHGYARLTCPASGQVDIGVRLADGSVFVTTAPLGINGYVATLNPLYDGRGGFHLYGDLNFLLTPNGSPLVGPISAFSGAWHRPASATWPEGIHQTIGTAGQIYRAPAPGSRILDLDSTLPFLEAKWTVARLPDFQTETWQTFTVSRGNQTTVTPPNLSQLRITSINPENGLITGTFRLGGVAQPASFRALVQGDAAYGYCLIPPPNRTTPGYSGTIVLQRIVPLLDSPGQALYTAPEPYSPTGTTLGKLKLGFMPQPGTEFVLVKNPGVDPVTGTFRGLKEGATVPINIGGSTIDMIISYRGGDGNDITLTWQQGAPPTQLRHVVHDQGPLTELRGMGESTVSTGNFLITSAPYDSTRGDSTGSVLIYNATTGALLHTLYPPQGIVSGAFGLTLAASGNRLAVSAPSFVAPHLAPFQDRGLVFLYNLPASGAAPELYATLHHPAPNDGTNFGMGLAFAGDRLAIGALSYTGHTERIYVYNASGLSAPLLSRVCTLPGTLASAGFSQQFALASHYLAVSHEKLYLFDLAQPASPGSLTFPVTSLAAYSNYGTLAASGSRLLVSNYYNYDDSIYRTGLIDLSLPLDQLRLVPLSEPFPNPPFGGGYQVMAATISANRVVLAVPGAYNPDLGTPVHPRLAVYDISRPAAPRLLTHFPITLASLGYHTVPEYYPSPMSLALSGNHLALGFQGLLSPELYTEGLLLYDLAQPAPKRLRKLLTAPIKSVNRNLAAARQSFALTGGSLSVDWQSDSSIHHYDLTSRTPTTPDLTLPPLPQGFYPNLAGSGRYLLSGAGQSVYDLHSPNPALPIASLGSHAAVSIAVEGNRFVVGEPPRFQNDFGHVFIHQGPNQNIVGLSPPNLAQNTSFGSQVAIQGNLLAVGDDKTVWLYDVATLALNAPLLTIPAPAAAANGGEFGYSIAISGRRVAISAPGEIISGNACGAVYLYDLDSASPTVPIRRWQAPSLFTAQRFGHSISLQGTRLAVGAPCDGPVINTFAAPVPYTVLDVSTGSAFLYDLASPLPGTPVATYRPDTQILVDGIGFGFQVTLSADFLAISAPWDDRDGWNNGALYIYGPAQ